MLNNLELFRICFSKYLDSSIKVDASGHQVELQRDFVDACVMMRGKHVVIALLSSNKGTCDVYLLKEDPAMGYAYDLDSSLHISEGIVLLYSMTLHLFV